MSKESTSEGGDIAKERMGPFEALSEHLSQCVCVQYVRYTLGTHIFEAISEHLSQRVLCVCVCVWVCV